MVLYTSTLTFLAFQFAAVIDDGTKISLSELEIQLDRQKDPFILLEQKFPGKFDFSILSQHDKEFLIDQYADIHFAVGPTKYGISNNGLGALLCYTLELIQRERSVLSDKGLDFQLEMDPNQFKGRDDSLV